MTDAELLQTYTRDQSEAAFAELVQRHFGLVYRTAVRWLRGDQDLAKDVAQSVFADLAKRAGKLGERDELAGWLYTSTRYAAAQIRRAEERRRARETTAMQMSETGQTGSGDTRLDPSVEAALAELGAKEREVLLRRFFEDQGYEAIGASLGFSADAARMRVERALERLKAALKRRGVVSSAEALAAALAIPSAQTVPAGLVATISHAAWLQAVAAGGTGAGVAIFMGMTKLNIAVVAALVAVGATTIAVQHHSNQELREELQAVKATPGGAMSGDASGGAPSAARQMEIANLRAELAALQAEKTRNEATRKPANSRLATGMVAVDTLGNRGLATPRAALATQLWAARGGDVDLEAQALLMGPKARERLAALMSSIPEELKQKYSTPEQLMAYLLSGSPRPVAGMQVLEEMSQGPDDVILKTQWQHEDSDRVITSDIHFHRDGQNWRLVVPPSLVQLAVTYVQKG